jgi:hypothetical protein
MSIQIDNGLKSKPASVSQGQSATLILDLSTDQSPSETAQIVYTVDAPGVVFDSTGSDTLTTTEPVMSTGTRSETSYSLSGPAGIVSIRAKVTPATPPERSGTSVTLKGAGMPAGMALAGSKTKKAKATEKAKGTKKRPKGGK